MMTSLVFAAALLGQAAEAPPRVRIVSLPDTYAPDLAPGEVLVPGSVHDVVPEGAARTLPPPSPRMQAYPPVPTYQAAPPPPYASSCYASSYQSVAPSYQAPAPAATYLIPSDRPPVYSTPMQATPAYGPQYAEPVPTARPRRRGRFALRGRILMEHQVNNRLEIGAGIGDGARWGGTPAFLGGTGGGGRACPGGT